MPEPPDSTKEATICRESQMERIWASDQVDLTGWQRDGSFTVKLSSKRLVMPSPGIGFGDLMVFIAVVVIVAVFLAAVRFLRTPVEEPKGSRRFDRALRRRAPLSADRVVGPSGVAFFHRRIVRVADGSRFFDAPFLPERRGVARLVVVASVAVSTPDYSDGSCVVKRGT